ncbi:MAG: hypothetical protein QFC55_06880, partial [Chloroflexota bacterium]|nr:hypothetical protein [Chloroflexota bacterium]
WLPDTAPEHREALSSMFAGIHPDTMIHPDAPVPLVPGVGIPDHLFADATPVDTGWNPALTAERPPTPPTPTDLGEMDVDYVGAPPPGPAVDALSGGQLPPPPPPTVKDLVGDGPDSIASIHDETHAEQFSADPLANPNDTEREAAIKDMALRDPVAFEELKVKRQQAALHDQATEALRLSAENRARAEANFKAMQDAQAETTAKMAAIDAQAAALVNRKIDPSRFMSNRSVSTKMIDLIGAIAGGISVGQSGGNGPNRYLEGLQHQIDQDIDAQKTDIENGRAGLGVRRGILAEEYARTGNLYQSAEAVRQATYASTIGDMQAQQQLRDPKGTQALALGNAIQDMAGRMAAARQAAADHNLKQELELSKARLEAEEQWRKQRSDVETQRHNMATEAAARAKAAGAGAGSGSATNPNYTVATGFFDPFSGSPIMGKRAIGGKGEDAKERKEVGAQLATYGHVQDYWAQLAKIGAKINYEKSLGESVWSKRKDTLGAEYDSAQHALVVYLTKELGDKLTQGQLDAQAHRIPERSTVFEARDPEKQIRDAQADADRDFTRDMNIVGIDAGPIIHNAQKSRASAPIPKADDAITAANEARARAQTPGEIKDADAAADAAKEQKRIEIEQKKGGDTAIAAAASAPAVPHAYPSTSSPAVAAQTSALNDAIDTYNQRLAHYHQLMTPAKGKGAVAPKHEDLVDAAMKVAEAKRGIDAAALAAHDYAKNHYEVSTDASDQPVKFQ